MTAKPLPQPAFRPTTRTIAQRAGLSHSAVAKALRNHPRISAATRERVLRLAAELGYRPDPQVAKLMRHLQRQRKPLHTATIAAVTNLREEDEQPYHRAIVASAKERADALGYTLTVLRADLGARRNPSLQRILRGRGVEGVLLLPIAQAASLASLLDWKQFSVVAANRTVLKPIFPRVVANAFLNMLLLSQRLVELGYRRIGLVANRQFDLQITPGFSAPILWQQAESITEPVRPLLYEGEFPVNVLSWFEQERPDVIVAPGARQAKEIASRLGLTIPGPIGFAVTTWQEAGELAGIDPHPRDIGAAAVELLHGLIRHADRGPIRLPTETLITGTWVAGPSVRRQSRRRR